MTNELTFDDENEILLRQVHPAWIQKGRITSQAFRPTPKDQNKLSVNRTSKTTPQEAYKLYTEERKLSSSGVWGVSVGEVREIADLDIQSNPLKAPVKDQSHCLIDFSKVSSKSRITSISSKLSDKARFRGCLFSLVQQETSFV
jgi:hypothetical protein